MPRSAEVFLPLFSKRGKNTSAKRGNIRLLGFPVRKETRHYLNLVSKTRSLCSSTDNQKCMFDTKGQHSSETGSWVVVLFPVQNAGGVTIFLALALAPCLMMLYICTKFCENVLKGHCYHETFKGAKCRSIYGSKSLHTP